MKRTLKPAYDQNGRQIGWELFLAGTRIDFFYRRDEALAALVAPLEAGESYWFETNKWRVEG